MHGRHRLPDDRAVRQENGCRRDNRSTAHPDVEPARLRTVSRVVRNVPRLEPGDLKLLRFASDYYQYPLGQAVLGSLPLRLRRVRSVMRVTGAPCHTEHSRFGGADCGSEANIDSSGSR